MCVKIKEFSIFKNATLNCTHDYLEIEFEIEDIDKVKHEQFGYFINCYGLERLNDKRVVSKCKKIRRQVLCFLLFNIFIIIFCSVDFKLEVSLKEINFLK